MKLYNIIICIWNYKWPLFNKDVRRDKRGLMIAVNSVIKDENKVSILGDKWEWLWLEEVASAYDSLLVLGFTVNLEKFGWDLEVEMRGSRRNGLLLNFL